MIDTWTRVYFPFADGLLGYDCAACGHQCCGLAGGFGLPREDLQRLLGLYPTLAHFARATAQPDYINLSGMGPRCFFLEDAGTCRIHRVHGWELKPYVCQTFPANQFSRMGPVLTVDLHTICPVDLTAQGGEVQPLRHHEILETLEGYRELVSLRTTRQPVMCSHSQLSAILDHEEWCRDLVLAHPGLHGLELAAVLHHAGGSFARHRPPALPPPGELAAPRAELERFRLVMARFLRAEPHIDDGPGAEPAIRQRLERTLAAIFPRVRLRVIQGLPALPHEALLSAFPRVLLAIQLLLRLAAAASNRAVQLRSVFDIAVEGIPVFWLLAHLDRVPRLEGPTDDSLTVRIPASQQAAMGRLLSHIHRRRDRGLPLLQLLEEAAPRDLTDRLMLLRSLPEAVLERLRFDP